MALRDKIAVGMSLPHRSPDPLALTTIGAVARRAEELGFRDLWVTENIVDDHTCLDPVVALTYAASVTRRIGVGCAVVVLPNHHPLTVANAWATLGLGSISFWAVAALWGANIAAIFPIIQTTLNGESLAVPRRVQASAGR